MKNSKIRVNYLLSAAIVRNLFEGPATAPELEVVTGAHYSTILFYVRALKAVGLVRTIGKVADSTGRCTIPVWEWAPDMPDIPHKAPNPAARSRTARQRNKAREVHQRLTLLGQGTGADQGQEGVWSAPTLDC